MPDLRFVIYFGDDYSEAAPEGPGWYIVATTEHEDTVGEVIPRVRLTNKQMTTLAKVLDKQVEGKPLNWAGKPGFTRLNISAEQAVQEQNARAKEIVKAKLAAAERAYQRVEQLRARANEFDDAS